MKRCPLCGGKAELIGSDLRETLFKVGCGRCELYVTARNGMIAQIAWNSIVWDSIGREEQ